MAPRELFTCEIKTRETRTVATDLVTHLVAEDKYVSVYYPGGALLLNTTIIALEAEFAGVMVRAHRNMLVRTSAIRRMSKKVGSSLYEMEVDGVQAPLRVSRSCRRTVLSARPDLRWGAV